MALTNKKRRKCIAKDVKNFQPKSNKINKKLRKKPIHKKYDLEALKKALDALKEGKMSVRVAAKDFGIPKSTLHRKFTGKSPIDSKMGPKTILSSKEEQDLVDLILFSAEHGFPITKKQLSFTIQKYLNEAKRNTRFKNNMPGKKWFKAFKRRHKNISLRKAQNLSKKRATITEKELRIWFNKLKTYLENKNLLDLDPSRIFNMDETNFKIIPDRENVLAEKGSQSVHRVVSNNEKSSVTVLTVASASGQLYDPLILYKLKKKPREYILKKVPRTWSVGNTGHGWMTSESFYKYFTEVFYKKLVDSKIQFPIIVYVDGHSSHFSLELMYFCKIHQIELIGLFPNATHILQPLDVALFKKMKQHYDEENPQYRIKNNLIDFPLSEFAPVLQIVWTKYDYSQCLKNGFRACGLHPVNADAVNYQFINKKVKKQFDALPETEEWVEVSEDEKLLELIEKNISSDILKDFEAAYCNGIWSGAVEYLALFEFWKKFKNPSGNDNASQESILCMRSDKNSLSNIDRETNIVSSDTVDTEMSFDFVNSDLNMKNDVNNISISDCIIECVDVDKPMTSLDTNIITSDVVITENDILGVDDSEFMCTDSYENESIQNQAKFISSSEINNNCLHENEKSDSEIKSFKLDIKNEVDNQVELDTKTVPVQGFSEKMELDKCSNNYTPISPEQSTSSFEDCGNAIFKNQIEIDNSPSFEEHTVQDQKHAFKISNGKDLNLSAKPQIKILSDITINKKVKILDDLNISNEIKEAANIPNVILNKKKGKREEITVKVVDDLLEELQEKKEIEEIKQKLKNANKETAIKNKQLQTELKNLNLKFKEKKTKLSEEKKLLLIQIKTLKKSVKSEKNKENLISLETELESLNEKLDQIKQDLIQCDIDALQEKQVIEKQIKKEKL